ncbi:hypothetical protein TNCV_4185221 [Trichonephila clavipes]|nr:hypothetical protein TNCV_4185221 [Trichonephila clavipes]
MYTIRFLVATETNYDKNNSKRYVFDEKKGKRSSGATRIPLCGRVQRQAHDSLRCTGMVSRKWSVSQNTRDGKRCQSLDRDRCTKKILILSADGDLSRNTDSAMIQR